MVKNCLIIDDCSDNRAALAYLLKQLDVRVREAATAQEGLELCKISMPDIILLDWMMTPMDGMGFIAELKNLENYKKPYNTLPWPAIIMCTAKATSDDVNVALKQGVVGYIAKPFSKEVLFKQMLKVGCTVR